MDPERRERLLLLAMFLTGLAMMAIAHLGERLGWWNDFGETLNLAGLVTSVLSLGLAVTSSAGRIQLRNVGEGVRQVGEDVRQVGANVEQSGERIESAVRQGDHGIHARLDQMQDTMQAQKAILAQIRDKP